MNVWNYEKISQFWFLPLVACLILGIEYFVVVKLSKIRQCRDQKSSKKRLFQNRSLKQKVLAKKDKPKTKIENIRIHN